MAEFALAWVLGVFGAVIGSFLNVAIYRLPREGMSVFRPLRSFCPQCERTLPWYENLPILGWLLLGGRCRGCKISIPSRYVVVEVLAALLFAFFGYRFLSQHPMAFQEGLGKSLESTIVLGTGLLLAAVCLVVTYIDLDFKIIPDEITWPGMALGLILSVAAPLIHDESWVYLKLAGNLGWERHLAALTASFAGLACGILVVLMVGWLGSLAFRKEAMGLGDVKYMGMVGALLGADGVLLVFFLGCVTGAIGGLIHRALTGERYIAFGPYLSLGVLLVLIGRREIMTFFLETWPGFVRSILLG